MQRPSRTSLCRLAPNISTHRISTASPSCVFVGKMFHHIEVRCQLVATVALKDVFETANSSFRTTMYAVGGTRPTYNQSHPSEGKDCPFDTHYESVSRVTGTTSALERHIYGSTHSTAS